MQLISHPKSTPHPPPLIRLWLQPGIKSPLWVIFSQILPAVRCFLWKHPGNYEIVFSPKPVVCSMGNHPTQPLLDRMTRFPGHRRLLQRSKHCASAAPFKAQLLRMLRHCHSGCCFSSIFKLQYPMNLKEIQFKVVDMTKRISWQM